MRELHDRHRQIDVALQQAPASVAGSRPVQSRDLTSSRSWSTLTGDGVYGEGAPFDQVLSTVAVPRVPYEWVAHTRPGGLVVTPWSSAYKPAGLLCLTVDQDGTATGGLINKTISFMPLRDQRVHRPAVANVVRDTDVTDVTHTSLHAHQVCTDDAPLRHRMARPRPSLALPARHQRRRPLVRVVPRRHLPILGTL